MALVPCPDCRAEFPDGPGPVHPYLGASPGCWKAYGEVLAKEYSDIRYGRVHRLTVDAYAAQHPGREERRASQSVTLHLVALHLTLEAHASHEAARAALAALATPAAKRRGFAWLRPPSSLGTLTVEHVRAAVDAADHCRRVEQWAACVWAAWAPHHPRIRGLAGAL